MRLLELVVGDSATVDFDINQVGGSLVRLYDGPIEGVLNLPLGRLEIFTSLYGKVWTGGPHVVIRYYSARQLGSSSTLPVCFEGRFKDSKPLVKQPGSVSGMAIVREEGPAVYVVDSFR